MDQLPAETWNALQTMETYPATVRIFLKLKTKCVGCHLARFCSLNDVSVVYKIPLKQLLSELEHAIQIPTR